MRTGSRIFLAGRRLVLLGEIARGSLPAVVAAGVALGVSGCATAHYEPRPLVPAKTAAAFDARSLEDPGLRRFLQQNLGREFTSAAAIAADFEALAWTAFYFNPTLDVARARWESAQAAIRSAAARPNPTVGLTPGYSTNPGGASPWFPAISFDLPLETGGRRQHRTRGAEQNAEAIRQAVFTSAWTVRSDLRRALLDLSVAQSRVERLRAQAGVQRRVTDLFEQRLRAGAIAASEVSPARLAGLRTQAMLADAERQLPLARQRVAVALGIPATALADLKLATPPVGAVLSEDELTAARQQALQSRPDILAALANYEASESAVALEVARQFPDLHLGPGYQWDQGQNKWTIGFTFEVPLFHHNEGPIAEAEAHRREAAAQFLAAQTQVIAEIDAAVTAQSAATAQVDALRKIQSQLDAQRARATGRQRAGAADQLETESAALEVETGALALADAEAQAALAAGQLEDALQIPFDHLATLAKNSHPLAASSSP